MPKIQNKAKQNKKQKNTHTHSYTPVPNYEGGNILKRQISQKFFTSEFMLPDSKKIFDALLKKTLHFWK